MTIYLKLPQRPLVPIEISTGQYGNNGYVHIDAGELIFRIAGDAAELAQKLHQIAELLTPRSVAEVQTRARPAANNWDWLTPQAVIEYFEQSPDLAAIAPDVRAVLGRLALPGETPANEQPTQLEQDLAAVRSIDDLALFDKAGQPVHGAQTRIGEALGIPNAGGYRERILAVLEKLQKSNTSNPAEERDAPSNERKAA